MNALTASKASPGPVEVSDSRPVPRRDPTRCPRCGAERVYSDTCYQCGAVFYDDAEGREANG